MSADAGCQVINMVVVSIPNEYIPQLMMAVEAKKGDGDAISVEVSRHCRHFVDLSLSSLYWARNLCLQNVISTTQAGLGRPA